MNIALFNGFLKFEILTDFLNSNELNETEMSGLLNEKCVKKDLIKYLNN